VVYLGRAGVVFQDRSNDCGLASLIMVFDHYGILFSRRQFEQRAGLGYRGASLLTMSALAMSVGLEAEGWRLNFEDLRTIQFPAILFVENHHFIVVDSIDGKDFLFVRDPAVGRLRIPRRKLLGTWNGETLVIITKAETLTREKEQK
jgi:ABC-type bacteriocin/lantibiotic exporter with double-glycine peptidase domain